MKMNQTQSSFGPMGSTAFQPEALWTFPPSPIKVPLWLSWRFPACAAQSSACIRKDSERTGQHVIILGPPISYKA